MLTGVAAFLLLLIALLAIPVTLKFRISWKHVFEHDIKLQWGFGLVRLRIPPLQPKPPSLGGDALGQGIGPLKRSSSKKDHFFAVVRRKELRRRLIRFIRDLWHAVQTKNLNLHIRVGLGDPADTGQLWAIVGPVAGMLANVQEASVIIEPEFLDATFELNSSGSIRIVPLQMVCLAVALLLSPAIWQGIRQMRLVGR